MKASIAALFVGMSVLLVAQEASAQVDCSQARTRERYIWCLEQNAQIAREEQRAYEDIARDLRRTHEDTGRALRYTPGGQVWSRAWDAPRYADNAGRDVRDRERYRREERNERRRRRR